MNSGTFRERVEELVKQHLTPKISGKRSIYFYEFAEGIVAAVYCFHHGAIEWTTYLTALIYIDPKLDPESYDLYLTTGGDPTAEQIHDYVQSKLMPYLLRRFPELPACEPPFQVVEIEGESKGY